jgi:flagellar motor switch protein FliN/FliY
MLPPPPANLEQILRLEVPIVVRLAERAMDLSEVVRIVPGTIIELPKSAEAELDLCVNNRAIGCGRAVKVGENFGLRITFMGNVAERVKTMAGNTGTTDSGAPMDSSDALADKLLAGQL